MADDKVVLDYTNRDYKAIRAQLVGLARGYMPEWTTVGETGDFGTLLLELFAYTGDVLNYYIDRMVSEAFLGTAVRRQSVLYIADMLGYSPIGQNAAVVPVTFSWSWDSTQSQTVSTRHVVKSAVVEGNEVTLTLTSSGTSIAIGVGQTITVSGVGNDYDGVFIVTTVTQASDTEPFSLTYEVVGIDVDITTIDISGASPEVSAGTVIRVPAGTKVFADYAPDNSQIVFETNFDVDLDSRLASPVDDKVSTGIVAVSATTTASEGTTVTPTTLATSVGVPSAEFIIPTPGVIDRTVTVYTREGAQVIPWARLPKISLAGPTQSAYTTYVDDENYTHILFGDGVAGRVPPVDSEIIVGFRYGAGAVANTLGKNTITSYSNDAANEVGVTVTNPRTPSGGSDVESVASLRYSIPRSSMLRERAVTLEDYQSLATQVPGVTKAIAYGQNYSTVFVRIASSADSAPYKVDPITHYKVTSTSLLVLTTTDLSNTVRRGTNVELNGFSNPALNRTLYVLRSWSRTSPISVVSVQSLTTDGTAEIITNGPHGYKVGQPIKVVGVDEDIYGSNLGILNGVYTVKSVGSSLVRTDTDSYSETNVVRYEAHPPPVGHSAITTVTTLGLDADAAVNGLPGFEDAVGGSYTLTPMTAGSGETVTSVDPEMQILIEAVEDFLSDKKLVGSTVFAEPVEWYDTDLSVSIHVKSLYSRKAVKAAVEARLTNLFSYDNMDFGTSVTIGQVYRTILGTDGVEYANIVNMFHTGDTASVGDITPPTHSIPRLNADAFVVSSTGGLANT